MKIQACRWLLVAWMMTFARVAVADNWGHWRGENGNSVSTTADPPTDWSPTKNIRWKTEIPGLGSGSPVVWGDRVFVVTAAPVERNAAPLNTPQLLEFRLLCIDRATGQVRWSVVCATATPHEGTHSTNGFASASPCTDGERVYASFGSRGVFCYTLEGQKVWSRELGQMTMRGTFGEGSSPTLAGERLIVPWDHEGPSFLYALDKRSGETLWRTGRDEPSCWATPLVVSHNGRQQIVMNGENSARAYDLESGRELWRCGGQTQRPAASAVAGHGLVFVGSGFRGSFLGAFRPDGDGDIQGTASVVWTVDRDTPDIASPLLSGGRLYYFKGKSGLLTCVDAATGEPFYSSQRTGLGTIYASPVAAAGRVYLTDRTGKTLVIKDASRFEVLSENSVGEPVDATPAPVDGELFIRGEKHLFCIAP